MEKNITDFLNNILKEAVKEKASDVIIKADTKPALKLGDNLTHTQIEALSPEAIELLAFQIMPPAQKENFSKRPEANFTYYAPDIGRFRTNVYKQKQTIGIVLRRIEEDIPDFEKLGLPPVLEKISLLKRGLVLVTGPTGCGKSTTLASMIEHRNKNTHNHIITLEDPIEFLYHDKNCLICQREIEQDTLSFSDGLKNAVRQAPDVLLIGEMRDLESVKSAVFFAETGHLVLSTLHSINTTQTIERILQFFPQEIHQQICLQLSLTLQSIVSQRLVHRKDGKGVIPAVEVMLVNARMQNLLATLQLTQIKRELDQFLPEGMQSFDHSLIELYKANLISSEEAIKNSDNANDMRLKLKTLPTYIKGEPGEERYS